jgi:heme-degrading monooxygenase HmoA
VVVYVSVSRLRVAPERVDELVQAFRDRLGAVDAFDGFQSLEVWASDREPGEVLMVSHWRDRACFRDYMRSEAHRASHDRVAEHLQRAIKLERLEHMHTYDVVAR